MGDIHGKVTSAFVYVNGEKVELLEDLRLALYPRFPDGTLLFDPSELPPREIPLCMDPDELGVTFRKLIPHGHYHAYIPDMEVKGELHPVTGASTCIYVTGLPLNTTAEILGRYFESFDMILEADIFTLPSGACNGRGWVILQNAEKLHDIPPVLEFFPRYFIHTFLSDRIPTRPSFPPISHGVRPVGGAGSSFADAEVRQVASSTHLRRPHASDRGRGAPKPSSALAAAPVTPILHFFCASIERDEITKCVEEGIFWPIPVNRRAFYSTLKRGAVNIIFVLQDCATIFGYARLLPPVDVEDDSLGCRIEWIKHHVFLKESDLKGIQSVPITRMSDGIPLKAEIGDSICKIADRFPSKMMIPECLGTPTQSGISRNNPRGTGVNDLGGKQTVGDRGNPRPCFVSTPPQPLGGRHPPRVAPGTNGKMPPRRRSYNGSNANNDSTAPHPSNGGGVPPRKL